MVKKEGIFIMDEIRIKPDGHVAKKGEYGWAPIEKSALAVFITPSFKEVLKTFGESIIYLQANGGKRLQKQKQELKNLGVTLHNLIDNNCVITYDKTPSKFMKHDDLTPMNIKDIIEAMDNYKIVDCAVTHLKIELKDRALKEIIENLYDLDLGSEIFHIEFVSKHCEGDIDRDKWEDTPYNSETLAPLKFKRTILECIRMIDDGQLFNTPKSRRKFWINWKPNKKNLDKGDYPTSPEEIALLLKDSFGDYGYVKYFGKTSTNQLELLKMK